MYTVAASTAQRNMATKLMLPLRTLMDGVMNERDRGEQIDRKTKKMMHEIG
jgi:hypothetical protein